MTLAGSDNEFAVINPKNDSVLFINANRPPTGQIAAQGFGLPCRRVTVTINVLDQFADTFECSPVAAFLPSEELIPREIMP